MQKLLLGDILRAGTCYADQGIHLNRSVLKLPVGSRLSSDVQKSSRSVGVQGELLRNVPAGDNLHFCDLLVLLSVGTNKLNFRKFKR